MKKLSLLAVVFLMCVCAHAQKTHTLLSRVLEDYDENYYFYNDKGLVDSSWHHQFFDQWYTVYQLNKYDDKGNNVRTDVWQLIDREWKNVNYVEYEYDDQGRVIVRSNFNAFSGEWAQGGRLEYVYNEKGQLDSVKTFLKMMDFVLYSNEVYIYNSKDQLVAREIVANQNLFGGEPNFAPMSKSTFEYDAQGRLTKKQNYNYDASTGEEQQGGHTIYTWDENGNVTDVSNYLGGKNPVSRNVYRYDTKVLAEKTNFPLQFEDWENEWVQVIKMSSNIIVEMDEWLVPVQVDTLTYAGTWFWTYEGGNVGNRLAEEVSSLRWTLNEGILKIDGVEEGSLVQVFNAGGHILRQERYTESGINLGILPAGIYMARIDGRATVKFIYSR